MDGGRKPKIVVLAGATASGKTNLAIELVRRLGGEVINADSMQVYRGMDIGTAKPSLEERRGIPHHLMDVVDPDQPFNAAIFRSMALSVCRDMEARGKGCFVVGGTGLYIKALLGGLFHCPPSDPQLRADLNRAWEEEGPARLYQRLKEQDPEAARKIHPHDRVRVLRALEILALTRDRPSELSLRHAFKSRIFASLKLVLSVEREKLYRRINDRCDAMMEAGLLHETEDLLSRGYSGDLKPMKAIGYRHMVRYLRGEWSLAEAVLRFKRDTRRYAKRQVTWFKSDPQYVWITPDDADGALDKIHRFLSS